MKSEESLGSCISLNNEGALLIERDMYDNAIRRLTSALQACRKYCLRSAGTAITSTKAGQVRFDLDVLFSPRSGATRKSQYALDDGFVYKSPLRLPMLLESCDNAVHLVMTAICFNLGIAHHVSAMKGEKSSALDSLKKSLQLYKTAERMHQTSSKSSKALFHVALLNNIGHLFKSLHAMDLSRSYHNRLFSLILYMTTYKKTDAIYYEDFLRFLLPSRIACASAA